MLFEKETIEILKKLLINLQNGFELPDNPSANIYDYEKIESIFNRDFGKISR